MALINRVTQLFKADFHAVLDRIEEPEQLLRQSIRDMEDVLLTAERRVQQLKREQDSLLARKDELDTKVTDLNGELDLCFEKQKDELARTLVRRKLEAERLLRRLQARIAANQQAIETGSTEAAERRSTLDAMKQKAELFSERETSEPADLDDTAWLARELTVSDEDIEVAFLREQQARSGS